MLGAAHYSQTAASASKHIKIWPEAAALQSSSTSNLYKSNRPGQSENAGGLLAGMKQYGQQVSTSCRLTFRGKNLKIARDTDRQWGGCVQ